MSATPPRGWTCQACRLEAAASTDAEAQLLAGIHDGVLHRGTPTAMLRTADAA